MTYGLLIYGGAAKTNLCMIESVQRILRAICKNTCCEQNQYCLRAIHKRNGF